MPIKELASSTFLTFHTPNKLLCHQHVPARSMALDGQTIVPTALTGNGRDHL
jgi:hypothetical protein